MQEGEPRQSSIVAWQGRGTCVLKVSDKAMAAEARGQGFNEVSRAEINLFSIL